MTLTKVLDRIFGADTSPMGDSIGTSSTAGMEGMVDWKRLYLEEINKQDDSSMYKELYETAIASKNTAMRVKDSEIRMLKTQLEVSELRYKKAIRDYKQAKSENSGGIYGRQFTILFPVSEVSKDTLKAQYKFMAKRYHPDRGGSTEKMQVINEAYQKLGGGK